MSPNERMPEELARQLAAFERRLRAIESVVAVLAALTGTLGTLALLALLDRFVDTPRWLRFLLAAGGGVVVYLSAVWWVRHWVWKRRDVRDLARLVQRQYPRLGDRLLGAVELSAKDVEATGASPALVRAALRQVAQEARQYDFRDAAPKRAIRRYGWAFTALCALLGIGLALAPEALLSSARRWLRPTENVERYTFTRIRDLPERLIVAHGEPFDIVVGLDPRSRWKPTEGVARISGQRAVRARIEGETARFSFPGQTANGMLAIRIGDDRGQVQIIPTLRPELVAMEARIEWPDYLRRPPETRPLERSRLGVLPDARVSFSGRAVRELESATLTGESAAPAPLAVEGATFSTEPRAGSEWAGQYPASVENSAAMVFNWTDRAGLSNARPYRLELSLTPDAPPTVEVEGIRGSVAILPDEVLRLRVRAADDFGVAEAGWKWRVDDLNADPTTAPPLVEGRAVAVRDDSGNNRKIEGDWRLAPAALETGAGRVITLWAWATDHRPGRGPTLAGPFRVFVMSPEEHARLVRQLMEQLAGRMEELLRSEEMQLHESEALKSLDDEALAHERAAAAAERAGQAERQNQSAALELAKEIENMIREGLRNSQINAEELQPWMAAQMALSEEAARAMAEAAEALARAAQSQKSSAQSPASSRSQPQSSRSSEQQTAEQRREQLAKAAEAQQRAADALRRTQQKTNEATENALARSFVNRLKEVARMERDTGADWGRLLPEIIGLSPKDLNAQQRRRLTDARAQHERAQREAQYIRNDLGAFFARTRKAIYDDIRLKMTDPDILQEFGRISQLADKIHLARGIEETERMARRFEEWAKMLEPPDDGGGSGGSGDSGGAGGGEGLEPEVILGMMRARVVQEMLREQTRAADEAPVRQVTERMARAIGDKQQRLTLDFHELSAKTKNSQVAQFLGQLGRLSIEARIRLAVPDTGGQTIAVQTQIIEAIAAALQQKGSGAGQGQDSAQGQGQQQGMASLSAVGAGTEAGPQGGGSMAGGDTAGVGRHIGPGSGDSGERDVARGARPDVSTWPVEYRDAIQAYYESIEGQP